MVVRYNINFFEWYCYIVVVYYFIKFFLMFFDYLYVVVKIKRNFLLVI